MINLKISGRILFECNNNSYFPVPLKDISLKTREIFTNLEPFSEVSGDGEKLVLNFEALKQRRFPPATENFLYHLAAAEQMLKI